MNLNPSHADLWRRIELADDTACHGAFDPHFEACVWCKSVVEILRGGSIYCPDCHHINAIGHSCSDWREHDDGTIDGDEVGRRWRERDAARYPLTGNPVEASVRLGQMGDAP